MPTGRHQLVLHYYPESFNVGLVVALCTFIVLTALVIKDPVLRRVRGSRPTRQ